MSRPSHRLHNDLLQWTGQTQHLSWCEGTKAGWVRFMQRRLQQRTRPAFRSEILSGAYRISCAAGGMFLPLHRMPAAADGMESRTPGIGQATEESYFGEARNIQVGAFSDYE